MPGTLIANENVNGVEESRVRRAVRWVKVWCVRVRWNTRGRVGMVPSKECKFNKFTSKKLGERRQLAQIYFYGGPSRPEPQSVIHVTAFPRKIIVLVYFFTYGAQFQAIPYSSKFIRSLTVCTSLQIDQKEASSGSKVMKPRCSQYTQERNNALVGGTVVALHDFRGWCVRANAPNGDPRGWGRSREGG